ncbi:MULTISPECIES: hypothetical protein [unclassified Streptomyces]|uniref:hypothetical protein n=1 Tax=unclassified Streptomyces TaxID=2593676 RepID=UPI0013190890|nr:MULTISPECIES: hypothetical protein [unclassified Streptomyces]QHC32392.1 hypothetical protein GR129_29980 [Streptomyces sp. HF10]WKE68580.1 hypothetical protein QHG49_05830 [Streptomyces sp. WP-1]
MGGTETGGSGSAGDAQGGRDDDGRRAAEPDAGAVGRSGERSDATVAGLPGGESDDGAVGRPVADTPPAPS